ncbi:hypothetical protein L798_13838 [Zootermopsis nevadensis]|uniref:Uncharacterized protein n=1 Tax=Zootermopsis nevadensis TaxID=136037 RepID=A0A067QTM0_ZOONE|nr:hypothetical protein L798_13838 [Zootermopsis nevadensis]
MIHQSRKFATTHSSFQTSPRWFSIVIAALLPVSIISSLPTHPGKVQHGRHSKLNLERRTLLIILEFSGSSLLFTYFLQRAAQRDSHRLWLRRPQIKFPLLSLTQFL